MRILIFGGTGEARELADQLVSAGHDVTTSLAGRTTAPKALKGHVRFGGFGGVEKLAAYFEAEKFDWVIDTTHPYAASMSDQLCDAVSQTKQQFLRVSRTPWVPEDNVEWQDMPSVAQAVAQLPEGARALLTSGQEGLEALSKRGDCKFFVRLIEQPAHPLPEDTILIIERPPYELHGELSLMREFSITHLITKNAGGTQTRPKIDAAAQLGVKIFMIERPRLPEVAQEVHSVAAALAHIQDRAD